MVNGLHLYSAFIQSTVQFMPLIHPFTHTFTHQRRLAAMQGTNRPVGSNRGLGVLLGDTSTRPGRDRTGNPPTARRQLYLLSRIAPHQCILLQCSLYVFGQLVLHLVLWSFWLCSAAHWIQCRLSPLIWVYLHPYRVMCVGITSIFKHSPPF